MTKAELVARAIELIGKQRVMRSPAIAEALDVTAENVHELLRPAVEAGRLVACAVEIPESGRVFEYRLSVTAGGALVEYAPRRKHGPSPDPIKERLREWGPSPESKASTPPVPPRTAQGAAEPSPHAQAPGSTTNKEAQMSTTEKILAAYKTHGPMTAPELRKHCAAPNIAKACSALAARGVLAHLGGGKRSTVYGLPGQKAPAAASGKVRDWAKRDGKKKRAALAKPKRRNKRVIAPTHGVAVAHGAFRPAIAADGSLLLLGATQAGELSRSETHVLLDFIRRLDEKASGALA